MSNFIQEALSRKKTSNPQMEYMWRVNMPETGEGRAVVDNSEINHRVMSFDHPNRSFEMRKIDSIKAGWKSARGLEIGNITIKISEMEDGKTAEYINGWMEAVQNPDGSHNPPHRYKKTITQVMMSVSGADLHVTRYTGCFPIEVSNVNYSYDATGILSFSITFAVDEVETEIIPNGEVVNRVNEIQYDAAGQLDTPFAEAYKNDSKFWDVFA